MDKKQFDMCMEACREASLNRPAIMPHPSFAEGWQACLEANGIGSTPPEGLYRLGEEVEIKSAAHGWVKGVIGAFTLDFKAHADMAEFIRRKPAWKPKDGEAVFLKYKCDSDKAVVGWITGKEVHYYKTVDQNGEKDGYPIERIKPFDASKIGKPWSEI